MSVGFCCWSVASEAVAVAALSVANVVVAALACILSFSLKLRTRDPGTTCPRCCHQNMAPEPV